VGVEGCYSSPDLDAKEITMTIRRLSLLLFLYCYTVSGQQAVVTVPDEPANLDTVKQELKHYESCKESNCYHLNNAQSHLETPENPVLKQ
jgi:hypothetical protein